MRHHLIAFAAAAGLLTACELEPDIEGSSEAVQGATHYGQSCSPADITLLERAMHFGRIASVSVAFEECIRQRMPRHVRCDTDPQPTDLIAQVLALAASDNPIHADCEGAASSAEASTELLDVGADQETYRWNRTFLNGLLAQLPRPPCSVGQTPGAGCRFRNSPWSAAAGTAWHEAMHQHGYGHDSDDDDCQPGDRLGDGTPVVAVSMPAIVGQCITDVLRVSGDRCGDQALCGTAGLRVIDHFDLAAQCVCVEDPGPGCWDAVDSDMDGRGDRCDVCPQQATNEFSPDGDADRVPDACDNCASVANSTQANKDGDARGDLCDNCKYVANSDQSDRDSDKVGDLCDNCPDRWNRDQDDRDKDKIGNICDPDRDGDGLLNIDNTDLCPDWASLDNRDGDNDGLGDPCDGCDITRGLGYDCKPLSQQLRVMFDERLDAIAETFRELGVTGPWGPWGPFTTCMFRCTGDPELRASAVKAALALYEKRGSKPGMTISQAEIYALLMGTPGATAAALDRFLSERLAVL